VRSFQVQSETFIFDISETFGALLLNISIAYTYRTIQFTLSEYPWENKFLVIVQHRTVCNRSLIEVMLYQTVQAVSLLTTMQ